MNPLLGLNGIHIVPLILLIGTLAWLIHYIIDLKRDNRLLRHLRNDAQDAVSKWSRCPNCNGIVKLTGWSLLSGTCKNCDYFISETEMELVDPAEIVKLMQEVQGRDYETLLYYRNEYFKLKDLLYKKEKIIADLRASLQRARAEVRQWADECSAFRWKHTATPVKTFAVEYEAIGCVFRTSIEAYSREEAMEQFRNEHPHVELRECWEEAA